MDQCNDKPNVCADPIYEVVECPRSDEGMTAEQAEIMLRKILAMTPEEQDILLKKVMMPAYKVIKKAAKSYFQNRKTN